MTTAANKPDFELTNDTPYLALMGELCGVYCEDLRENWPHYNGIALYIQMLLMYNFRLVMHSGHFREWAILGFAFFVARVFHHPDRVLHHTGISTTSAKYIDHDANLLWHSEAIWHQVVWLVLFQITRWGLDKMAAIFQTTFSNGLSWIKIYEF